MTGKTKQQKPVWVFGNPDFAPDALPLKILPALKRRLPEREFIVKDPHEEWNLPRKLVIIDTVRGIDAVTTFTSLDQFKKTPRLTVHDFDLLTNLKWLAKLNKLPPFLIIGLPPDIPADKAAAEITGLLRRID